MQSLESAFGKALHQPMPFTTGGQTITDRLTAAKHSLAGSQLGKTICKATTEELMAPKKKHCDYLLHCTNEPNVSIPSMANLLIERTQNPNWIVAYKALITMHNLMCYGNERFSQYLASCNTTINLSNYVDKSTLQNSAIAAGYDMSTHVRRYAKYMFEKIHTYRLCAFDFCKVKRGREDGLLRTMHTDKLLKTLPILQNQIDALLEFQVSSSELNNGVINCSFILLFRDLIRLFACYNDGIINLLEKFFDMNKKQCREALDLYKLFLFRLDKVAEFLRVAEAVGIDRGEIPDLTRAPASLLEALEAHLYYLEGGKGAPPSSANAQQMANQQIYQQNESLANRGGNNPLMGKIRGGFVDDFAKEKYLEEEKERLRQYEEQRQKQLQQQQSSTNPFGSAQNDQSNSSQNQGNNPYGNNKNDLLSFYDLPNNNQSNTTNPFSSEFFNTNAVSTTSSASTNPFLLNNSNNAGPGPGPVNVTQSANINPFENFTASSASYCPPRPSMPQQNSFANFPMQNISTTKSQVSNGNYNQASNSQPPGGIYSQTPFSPPSQSKNSVDNTLSNLVGNLGIGNNTGSQHQRIDQQQQPTFNQQQQQPTFNQQQQPTFNQPQFCQPQKNMMSNYGSEMPYQQQPQLQQQPWNTHSQAPMYNSGGYGIPGMGNQSFGQPNFAYPNNNVGFVPTAYSSQQTQQ